MASSVNPDQTAPEEAVLSEFTLLALAYLPKYLVKSWQHPCSFIAIESMMDGCL